MSFRTLAWGAPFLGWLIGLAAGILIATRFTYTSPLIWIAGGASLGFIAGYIVWFCCHPSLVCVSDIVHGCRQDMRVIAAPPQSGSGSR